MSQWTDRRAAEHYDRARPPWPVAVRAFLASIGPAPGCSTAVDVAAGTGRLTEHVLAVASVVIAVEPSQAQLTVLRRRLPAVRAIRGSAEAMPIASGCV